MPKTVKGWMLFGLGTTAVVALIFRVKMVRTAVTGLA